MNRKDQDSQWKNLYKIGGIAAFLAGILFRKNWSAEFILLRTFGIVNCGPDTIPISAVDWFSLFQDNWFLGILLFNFFDVVNYALVGLLFLALYGKLSQFNNGLMLMAELLGFTGIILLFSSNQSLAMLNLSAQYATASTEAERASIIAAGKALLAIHNPGRLYQGTQIYLSYVFVPMAGLMMSILMLHDDSFGKKTSWSGIIGNTSLLTFPVVLILIPKWAVLPIPLAAPFLMAWHILSGMTLIKIGRDKS